MDKLIVSEKDIYVVSVGEVGAPGEDGWTGKPRVNTVAYTPTVNLNCDLYDVFDIPLDGNIAINFTNPSNGQKILLMLKQGTGGSKTVTWENRVYFGDDIQSFSPSTQAGKLDLVVLVYRSASDKFMFAGYIRGFVI